MKLLEYLLSFLDMLRSTKQHLPATVKTQRELSSAEKILPTLKMSNEMKRFQLKRIIKANTATLGIIFDLDKEICRTLENPWLDNKQDISCIPAGIYTVRKDNVGKFQYWALENVPNRSNIEMHNGNRERDTKGCIIIGKTWGFLGDELAVLNSINTLKELQKNNIFPETFELEII